MASGHHYEAIQMDINEDGFYTIFGSIESMTADISVYVYKHNFYPLIPLENLLEQKSGCSAYDSAQITVELQTNIRYILVVTTCSGNIMGKFLIKPVGRNNVSFHRTDATSAFHMNYSSTLGINSQKYNKYCASEDHYYETLRLTVLADAYYTLSITRTVNVIDGPEINIYKSHFDPLNSLKNLIPTKEYFCRNISVIKYSPHLLYGVTYVLVVTTRESSTARSFSITVYGPTNVGLQRIVDDTTYCYVGGACNTQVKSIGLTLDDILRLEIKRNMTIHEQTFAIRISAAFSIIMLTTGVVSSFSTMLTFQNASSRTVGFSLYLLASSATSLLTITIFSIKFWFVILTQMDTSVSFSVLQGGCKLIETVLKLFFYWDAWLNACVAMERAVSVYKGVGFDKEKSKRFARWIIFILPIAIMGTIIHEPLYRHIFRHEITKDVFADEETFTSSVDVTDTLFWCITTYPQSLQDYNTSILFIHLLGPFSINLLSSLFIIFRSARRRADAQRQQTYRQHLREQWKEHKQLVVSPIILVLLSTPRLVISLLSGCIGVSHYTWLYLCGYFISFTPSILVFIVFVLPSNSYRKAFKESFFRLCKQRQS
ncbi:unnamed protein product [Adineta ricciae]|uniref:G-protein coupled receptors family 1 profile domain-containing protein n=1 Tax=Adineta ricciae TaxID=249248 RepID=A0A815EMX7_ADIRI|nr:unnamed protein product [Adineta ricciae]CAF1308617.1 unnamed protein product [Adineta ricciae]